MIVAARKHRRPRLPAPSQCILCTDHADYTLGYKANNANRLVMYGLCSRCHELQGVFERVEKAIAVILAAADTKPRDGAHHA